ncbi:hypothetical protein HID58_027736 [Brassica napus]|uniref:Uncharacterized protein n=1 Tax=Brassica napus TaxID=3708 RepID=A0ABQ8CUY1_BRANA|nr:hypothetical protein HID58_027736 [Brassica napus]
MKAYSTKPVLITCTILLLLIVAQENRVAAAEQCNPMQLMPCEDAIMKGSIPSNECCTSSEISDSTPLVTLSPSHNLEAAETARDSLELAFRMSNILETGLDRHTLSVLIALCDLGLNPEALAAVVKELRQESGNNHGNSSLT